MLNHTREQPDQLITSWARSHDNIWPRFYCILRIFDITSAPMKKSLALSCKTDAVFLEFAFLGKVLSCNYLTLCLEPSAHLSPFQSLPPETGHQNVTDHCMLKSHGSRGCVTFVKIVFAVEEKPRASLFCTLDLLMCAKLNAVGCLSDSFNLLFTVSAAIFHT